MTVTQAGVTVVGEIQERLQEAGIAATQIGAESLHALIKPSYGVQETI